MRILQAQQSRIPDESRMGFAPEEQETETGINPTAKAISITLVGVKTEL